MTRLTIRRGGTKRVRATFFADQSAGIARDLSVLTLILIDQSPNIAPPALAILPPATGGQIEVLGLGQFPGCSSELLICSIVKCHIVLNLWTHLDYLKFHWT